MNEQQTNPQPGEQLTEQASPTHGECCDECKQKCKRSFWTSVLNAVIKISTIVLAAFGIQSFNGEQ